LGDTVRRASCAKGWSIEHLSKRSGVPGRLIGELLEANPFVLCLPDPGPGLSWKCRHTAVSLIALYID
jgi:hypothetical protein